MCMELGVGARRLPISRVAPHCGILLLSATCGHEARPGRRRTLGAFICNLGLCGTLRERRERGRRAAIPAPSFPLPPGTVFSCQGTQDGQPSRDVMEVIRQQKLIMGVTTTVVLDSVYLSGTLAEQTFDWYAQDDSGTVWYFGE